MTQRMSYYAVAKGRTTGIFSTWEEARESILQYPGAIYQKHKTEEEARAYLLEHQQSGLQPGSQPATNSLDTLTAEQQSVFDFLLRGDNVFLTGGGGVGKSHLIHSIYADFPGMARRIRNMMHTPKVQLCALTGCAALLLGNKAKTIHSWAGIGLGKGTVAELLVRVRRNRKAMKNWLTTDLLVIDEISMMTAELLDKLDEIARKVRSNRKPFGGLQVLLVGDFHQLPPISRDGPIKFAFESQAWLTGITTMVELTIIQRQKDEAFQKIMKEARIGALSEESCTILQSREGLDWRKHKIKPTLLFPRRAEVDMINESNLQSLQGERHQYKAKLTYDGKVPQGFTENDAIFQQSLQKMDSDSPYSVSLELAQGAQVMLICNLAPELGLVNGSRGVIVEFTGAGQLPVVEFVNGVRQPIGTHAWPIDEYEFVSRVQIPLKLAYASTIHKSQGCSLDSALIDIGSSNWEHGQSYTALSRCRSLDALYVYDFTPTSFKVHPVVTAFYANFVSSTMSPAERDQLHETWKPLDSSVKSILSEPSIPIRGITVIKEEPVEAPMEAPVEEPGCQLTALFQRKMEEEAQEKKEKARAKAKETRARNKAAKECK
jgi:ATP-dependent DNA helicase PIF1